MCFQTWQKYRFIHHNFPQNCKPITETGPSHKNIGFYPRKSDIGPCLTRERPANINSVGGRQHDRLKGTLDSHLHIHSYVSLHFVSEVPVLVRSLKGLLEPHMRCIYKAVVVWKAFLSSKLPLSPLKAGRAVPSRSRFTCVRGEFACTELRFQSK